MSWLLIKSLLRDWRRHPWQILFSIVGVALGVAVVAGIDLANESALEEFHQSNRLLDGMATHRIMGPGATLDQEWFRVIKVNHDLHWGCSICTMCSNGTRVHHQTQPDFWHVRNGPQILDSPISDAQLMLLSWQRLQNTPRPASCHSMTGAIFSHCRN